MTDLVHVRDERTGDLAVVLDVHRRAFDHDPDVADLWCALAQRPGSAGFVAELEGQVVGHVGLSWGWVDAPGRLVDVLVLSPLGVVPERARRGIGGRLVTHAVQAASDRGAPVVFLEGDPSYYSRLGFEPAVAHGFTPPSVRIPAPAFQCVLLATHEPSISGALVYPDVFWAHDCVGLRGEGLLAVERALGVAPPG